MVNRSASWAEWDEELLASELLDLQTEYFDLALTGFGTKEIDDLIFHEPPAEDAVPPLSSHPITRPGDLWLCGPHRVLCADSSESVARLLDGSKPFLMVTDPPYGTELDSGWRDRAGLNACGNTDAGHTRRR